MVDSRFLGVQTRLYEFGIWSQVPASMCLRDTLVKCAVSVRLQMANAWFQLVRTKLFVFGTCGQVSAFGYWMGMRA